MSRDNAVARFAQHLERSSRLLEYFHRDGSNPGALDSVSGNCALRGR